MRKLVFVGGAALIGLVGACLIAEAAVRLAGLRPERYELPRWYVLHEGEYKHWGKLGRGHIKRPGPYVSLGVTMGEYVPGATLKVVFDTDPRGYFDDDNGVVMRINSLGLRGPAVEVGKAEGVYRILGLGDSFTFGSGVRDEDTFLRRLEQQLNGAPQSPGRRFEVLNAGVQGYNTRDELIYLERRWLDLDPDLVLIGFYINDAYSDEALLNMGQSLGIYEAPQGPARWSRLYDLLQHRLRARSLDLGTREYYEQAYFADPRRALHDTADRNVDWDVSRRALHRAAQLSRTRGFRLGLILLPELYRLDGRYPFEEIHQLVREAAETAGIPVLDLLDTFRGRADRDLWVHPSDHHPNELAHELAAEALATFVREQLLGSAAQANQPSP